MRSPRSPHPYTFVVNGTGVMGGTEERQSTDYVAQKPASSAAVAAPEFSYGADDPSFGATTSYKQMRRGMGLRQQRSQNAGDDEQYDHAVRLDLSVWPWVMGPDITDFTPATTDATNGATGFVKVGSTLYCAMGRYALQRVDDTSWTVAQDFGSGKCSTDCIAFYSNAHAAPYGLFAMGDAENFWYVTAGSFTQTSGGNAMKARAFGVAARELFRAHSTNALTKADLDADWTLVAEWGSEFAFDVGDQSAGIVRLPTTAAGVLLVVKEDGVYTVQGRYDTQPGYDLKLQDFLFDANNGKANARWGNETYIGSTYSGFWRYSVDASERLQVGPELMIDGSNVVSGYVTAAAGTSFALYGGFWNPSTSKGYLCKFLGMTTIEGRTIPVWHGSLSGEYSAKIQAMAVDTAGADAGHARLYFADGAGVIHWFQLPCTPHPADCPDYTFTTTDATLFIPRWTGGFPANEKALEAVTMTAENFSADTSAEVSYRTDPSASYSAMSDTFDTATREKVEFPNALATTTLDIQVTVNNAANDDSPRITGLGLHHQLHTPFRQLFQIYVLAEDGLIRRDGTPYRRGRDRVRDVIETATATAGGVALTLPDGQVKQVRVRSLGTKVVWNGPRQCRAYVVECAEVRTATVLGSHARIMALGSHAAMMNYLHQELMAI